MNIIICGAGEVGGHLAKELTESGHNVTLVDRDSQRLHRFDETLDVATFVGNAAEARVLVDAGADKADVVIAATDRDEINLLCASVAKAVGAPRAVARVHHRTFFDDKSLDYSAHLHIDHLICPEHSAAIEVASTLRNGQALAIEHFSQGRINMQEFRVDAAAPAIGRQLSMAGLPKGSIVAAVERKNNVFIPGATTTVSDGDKLVLVANDDVFDDARGLFRKATGRRKLVLMGGEATSVWLAETLRDRDWSIRLFETDRRRAESLAEKLNWVTVMNADVMDDTVFREEQIGLADAFAALTDEDERNIMAGVRATAGGVENTLAIVKQTRYLDLLSHVGVKWRISPSIVAAREIQTLLQTDPVQKLRDLLGDVSSYSIVVSQRSRIVGKTLREIKLTPNWMLAAIRRDKQVWVPSADDAVFAGDTVLVIGKRDKEKSLKQFFDL
jgi:trk system potassium uptake protein TrkA